MANGPTDTDQVLSDGTSGDTNEASPSLKPDDAAIYVDGLAKTFSDGEDAVTAVDDVSFTVAPGEVVGLLGPNGAGKTTTIKSILGLILPDEGEVRVHGIDIHPNPRAAYEHVDAMLEGARNDYWRLTVQENLHTSLRFGDRTPTPSRSVTRTYLITSTSRTKQTQRFEISPAG